MKFVLWVSFFTSAIGIFQSPLKASDLQRLSKDRFRVYWYLPLASSISPTNSWFEIMYCRDAADDKSCNQLYKRVPADRVLKRGVLKLETDFNGELRLLYKAKADSRSRAVLASYNLHQDGWFPRMEICNSRVEAVDCDYEILFHPDRSPSEIELKIYFERNS